MISVRNLCKRYAKVSVLRSLNIDIQPGRITGIAGPNACGKTTLIKSILGLVFADSGEITVNGQSVATEGYRQLIGYMPQAPDYPKHLCANELFALLKSIRGQTPSDVAELIAGFQLSPFLSKPFAELSTGTKQKVSAVSALMFKTPILILDEPTAGFDPVASSFFKSVLLSRANSGSTILIVSHILPELEQLIDNLIFLLDGTVLFSGSLKDLYESEQVENLELGIIRLLERPGRGTKNLGVI